MSFQPAPADLSNFHAALPELLSVHPGAPGGDSERQVVAELTQHAWLLLADDRACADWLAAHACHLPDLSAPLGRALRAPRFDFQALVRARTLAMSSMRHMSPSFAPDPAVDLGAWATHFVAHWPDPQHEYLGPLLADQALRGLPEAPGVAATPLPVPMRQRVGEMLGALARCRGEPAERAYQSLSRRLDALSHVDGCFPPQSTVGGLDWSKVSSVSRSLRHYDCLHDFQKDRIWNRRCHHALVAQMPSLVMGGVAVAHSAAKCLDWGSVSGRRLCHSLCELAMIDAMAGRALCQWVSDADMLGFSRSLRRALAPRGGLRARMEGLPKATPASALCRRLLLLVDFSPAPAPLSPTPRI